MAITGNNTIHFADNAPPASGNTTRQQSTFLLKLFNWEYWSPAIANAPVVMFWLWFALRARNLFFFSAVNPAIETGGVMGESKIRILRRIPARYLPLTVFIEKNDPFHTILVKLESAGLAFPLIAKPNVGERGLLVSKIHNEAELEKYRHSHRIDFIIQEFLSLPLELAVMHHRFPETEGGKVTSVCIKETLKVTGDGRSTIAELMAAYPRASLQLPRFQKEFPQLLNTIPAAGETLELEPIGNHCRGTMFLNGNHHIDDDLHSVFNEILSQMDGIHYGRFDLKCSSVEDLKQDRRLKIMEYNGIAAEPAHIYDPSYPFFRKYRDIYRHWKIIFDIYRQQAARGVPSMSFREALDSYRKYTAYKKSLWTTG